MGGSVRKQKREVEKIVRQYTEDYEISTNGNGHIRVTINGPICSRSTSVASTASDHRARLNFVGHLKALLIATGVTTDE